MSGAGPSALYNLRLSFNTSENGGKNQQTGRRGHIHFGREVKTREPQLLAPEEYDREISLPGSSRTELFGSALSRTVLEQYSLNGIVLTCQILPKNHCALSPSGQAMPRAAGTTTSYVTETVENSEQKEREREGERKRMFFH